MGDHRASIKIEFHMHGVEKKADMWINWSPEDWPYGLDSRVAEFFDKAVREAMDVYNEEQWEATRESRERQERAKDEAEYARLKAKLHPANGG